MDPLYSVTRDFAAPEAVSPRLFVEGTVVPPQLVCSLPEGEALVFSKVAEAGAEPGETQPTQSVLLTNPTPAPARFTVCCPEAFSVSLVNGQPVPGGPARELELPPHGTLSLTLDFEAPYSGLVSLARARGAQTAGEVRQTVEEVRVSRDLELVFPGGERQCVPLVGLCHRPVLCLAQPRLQLGPCLVGQALRVEVILLNRGVSATQWRCEAVGVEPRALRLDLPAGGRLPGYTSEAAENGVVLPLAITALRRGPFQVEILFSSATGEPCTLQLSGEGTVDEGVYHADA